MKPMKTLLSHPRTRVTRSRRRFSTRSRPGSCKSGFLIILSIPTWKR